MSLKLWHQSTTELSRDSAYSKALVRRAREVLGDSVVLDTFGLPAGTYRGRSVSVSNSNAFVYHRILDRLIDNALQAEREGYDAFIIGSYSEPFLKETRAAVNIPVLSLFETTLLVGCSLGTRTAFITTSPPVVDMINKSVASHRMADRVGDVVSLAPAFEGLELHAAFNDPSRLIDSFQKSSTQALDNGADVLVPAEGIIAVILTQAGVTRFKDAPVIDVFGVTWSYAAMFVNLRKTAGMNVTRRGWYAQPDPELIQLLAR
jgi:allantoin racemase